MSIVFNINQPKMARSPKDDPRYNEIQNNSWNYPSENSMKCAPGSSNDRQQPSISTNPNVTNDNSMFVNTNFGSDVYNMNKHVYSAPTGETDNVDGKIFNNTPNVPRNPGYGNAMLNLGNGQVVPVFYDENNKQLIFPVSGQYELFNHSPGSPDVSLLQQHLFTINQEYAMKNNVRLPQTSVSQNPYQNNVNPPTSNFLKDLIGNLEPNSSGTYSPFGHNYPLNHPDAPNLNIHLNPMVDQRCQGVKLDNSPKRNENSPLADTSNKKRIVAEVKPMRPSYSDVLAKNTKNNSMTESNLKTKQPNVEVKSANIKINTKLDKSTNNFKQNDDMKQKIEKKQTTISSGSESGDINTDDNEKRRKPNKKSKKHSSSHGWSSLDDIPNEENINYDHDHKSQFIFIENQEKPIKKEKKVDNSIKKNCDKNNLNEDEFQFEEENEPSTFVFQEGQNDFCRSKKKKDTRNYHKAPKPVPDKKKGNQMKFRRNKPGYLGLAQNYLEHWGGATWKALVWFFYLLSDICGMSFHLSFDLCTSMFTQTYVSSQAVWRSGKQWLNKISNNKYLLYVDRKFGHTRIGFWRKFKWFKKETEVDSGNDSARLNANIPLPATGEEAMKRLLACKGKDPYSILGVSVTCTDEEIKRYYRRQAFLVHPDKNQQPGAEEAFKILQHAFDLIGEPERREAYERRALESRHVEAAWGELSQLLAQLQDKMEFAANTIRCTNCGRRHKRVLTSRPCYAARYCTQCKIRHSAKEGDIWAESRMMGLLVMYYACMDGAVYQITQWASCQKKNLKQLRPDCHIVQYRIVLGNKAAAASDFNQRPYPTHDQNLEDFLNNLYNKSGVPNNTPCSKPPSDIDPKKRRNKKSKA